MALVLSVASAQAQPTDQPDETLPGFNPNHIYESRGVDNISLYSGDSGVVIPLGPEYPLGPDFTWSLKAFNSSKLWYFVPTSCGVPPPFGYPTSVSRAWVYGDSTLGIGWTLELGYVDYTNNRYVSPDGARHKPLSTGTVTRDNTRLRILCGSSTSCTVEFPDGIIESFTHQYNTLRPTGGSSFDFATDSPLRLGLTSISNRFGTTLLTVGYVGSYPAANAAQVSQITLNPGTAQARSIVYTWGTDTSNGLSWPVVTQITFPSAAGAGQELLATFTYDQTHPILTRNYRDNSDPFPLCGLGPSGPYAYVPFLKGVSFADASAATTPLQSYGFSYFLSGIGSDPVGVLNHIALPSGGTIDYNLLGDNSVGHNGIPADLESSGTGAFLSFTPQVTQCHPFDVPVNPVATRLAKPFSSDSGISTSYQFDTYVPANQCSPGTDDWRITRRTLVTESTGNASSPQRVTKYLFHTDAPTTRDPTLVGIEIERRYYADTNYGGAPVRTQINCYDADTVSDGYATHCGFLADAATVQTYNMNGNARRQATVTWYGANPTGGGTCAAGSVLCSASVGSNYVPGSFAFKTTTISTTTTTMAGWTSRMSDTFWIPQTGSVWLLDVFSQRDVTDNGTGVPAPAAYTTTYTFDLGTGFLQSHSTSDSTNGTLARTFSPDGAGNPFQEVIQGTSGLSGTLTDTRTFQSGLETSAQRTGISWKSFDVTRDANTGLVASSRDANHLQTNYTYDSLGRLVRIDPPTISGLVPSKEASTTICYMPAVDDSNPPLILVKKDGRTLDPCSRDDGTPGVGSGTFEGYQYDGLGRVIRHFRRMPNTLSTLSYFAVQETRYDVAGHQSYVSEWIPCGLGSSATSMGGCIAAMPPPANPGPGTTWSNFDVFGRARTITRADGSVITISFDDPTGPTNSDTYASVTVSVNGSPATTVTKKDVLGRIVSVTEPAVGGVANVTTYSYTGTDKLASVTQSDSTGHTQTRTFVHDAFGFLRSENTPEKGAVTYSSYDAIGDAQAKTEGGINYVSTFDADGRLLTAGTTNEAGGARTYLQHTYDAGGGYPLGRLTSRTATNFALTPAATIADSFIYGGLGGRISSQTTTISGAAGSSPSTTQKWFYNDLGSLAQRNHPHASGLFAELIDYSSGLPVAVRGNGLPVVKAVVYQASGALASYATGNSSGFDVTTTIAQDPSAMPRPARISTVGASTNFDTLAYGYDGAGNILSMGTDVFTYDARSRLLSAKYGASTQPYSYDRFGNLLSKGATSYSVNALNNRLTTSTYDARGNLTTGSGHTYTYDALNHQIRDVASGIDWKYLFDASDERIVKIPINGTGLIYTFRDESKKIATEYTDLFPTRDNVYLGNLLVGSYSACAPGWLYYSSDHLSSPRLVTNALGQTVESRKYWPYGDEFSGGATGQRVRFASMERDVEANRYYDHARAHDFGLGRFLSPDELGGSIGDPQSWNRYAYARNNPVRLVDVDGKRWDVPPILREFFDKNTQIRKDVSYFLERTGNGFFRQGVDSALSLFLPTQSEFVGSVATIGMADMPAPTGEFSIIHWEGYPENLPKPSGPFRVLEGEEYEAARRAANNANRTIHAADPSLAGKQIHEIQPVKFGGNPTDPANKLPLPPPQHGEVTTWWHRFLRQLKEVLDSREGIEAQPIDVDKP